MDGTIIVATATLVGCFLGWLETRQHRKNLAKIPIRIHVNGTRGKSGVARLIAAGLRAGGLRTFAKTTGTLARAIFPDGDEYPIFRPGRTNVIEQIRMIRLAAEQNVDAMVIECMALHPTLQSLCELKFVQSTHGVLTNARADHLDVMGPTAEDVAKALASTTPVGGKLFTAERKYLSTFCESAADRGSDLIAIDEDDVAGVTQDELNRFAYFAHGENVALALRVCAEFGIDRQTALSGMWAATPDPGVMKILRLRNGHQKVVFVNGFAANDPESTGKIWEMMLRRYQHQTRIAVINCRADRRQRSVQLGEAVCQWSAADHYIVVGTGTEIFERVATEHGIDPMAITTLEGSSEEKIASEIVHRSGESAVVMGMGNTAGVGLGLVDYLEHKSFGEVAKPATIPIQDRTFQLRQGGPRMQEAA